MYENILKNEGESSDIYYNLGNSYYKVAEMGLDKPLWQQYAHYIWGVLHGDLGISLKSRIPVWRSLSHALKPPLSWASAR